jgi:hypothetical protein
MNKQDMLERIPGDVLEALHVPSYVKGHGLVRGESYYRVVSVIEDEREFWNSNGVGYEVKRVGGLHEEDGPVIRVPANFFGQN